ncbi:hypothetical protein ACQKII_19120 [Lysinibacillus sp. NPDC048646]|uniref:hypothetical protein n=1 Tax=Lysinibacillus sp. NPDC048646 TaxID=3390574 RepID=UPI003CFDECCB
MRDLFVHIPTILKPLGLPVVFNGVPTGLEKTNQFITFLEVSAKPIFEAGEEEIETERLIQLNVWSVSSYHHLVESIKQLMKKDGYERILEYDVPYEEGESHFNRVLQFVFFDD